MDYHPGNLMVQDGKTITKIDHGRSYFTNFKDFSDMVKARHYIFSLTGYSNAINHGNLSFSIEKYSQALNQMLEQYDERQMEAVIDQKFDELKNAGFEPSGTLVFPMDQDKGKLLNSFDELKQFYKDQMRERATIMRDVAQSAEIVSKFSNVSNEFKNGNWIETFAKSPIQDPVAYAAHHNIQIEGQNALEWAYKNNYKIKHSSATISETTTEKQWKKDDNGKWHEEEAFVTRNRTTKQAMHPIEYIAALKLSKKGPLSKSEEEFIDQAIALNLTNSNGVGVQSMLGNVHLKKVIKPAIATIQSQDKDTTSTLGSVKF
jgi:hypothetical protein